MTEKLRSIERKLTEPLAKEVAKLFSANTITFIALAFAITGFLMFWRGLVVVAGVCILANGFFDLLDGGVARARNKAGMLGSFCDRIADKYSDMLFIGGALIGGICHPLPAIVALIGIPMATYTNSAVEQLSQGKAKRQNKLSLRFVRIFVLIIGSFAYQVNIAVWLVAGIVIYALISRTILNFILLNKLDMER